MAKKTSRRISAKQGMIDKSNSRMVLVAGVAAFITVFSLVAAKSLVTQMQYQNKVISAKKTTKVTLQENLKARDNLVKKYNSFVERPINIIGGDSFGNGGSNGDNASLVIDALPFEYDFPALATSLEKIISGQNVTIGSIAGTDDALQQKALSQATATPQPVPIPVQIQVNGDYAGMQRTIMAFQNSIRPFIINHITLSGGEGSMGLSLSAQTYYQPAKALSITKEVVK